MKNLTIDRDKAANYLSKTFNRKVHPKSFKELGTGVLGVAYLIELEVDGEEKRLVLKTLSPKDFGQNFPADRANTLIYAHSVYNKLPNHVRSYDAGAILGDSSLVSFRRSPRDREENVDRREACFQGKYYTIRESVCEPKSIQRLHPPILVRVFGKDSAKTCGKIRRQMQFPPSISEGIQRILVHP